jgi:hypothetical protein
VFIFLTANVENVLLEESNLIPSKAVVEHAPIGLQRQGTYACRSPDLLSRLQAISSLQMR